MPSLGVFKFAKPWCFLTVFRNPITLGALHAADHPPAQLPAGQRREREPAQPLQCVPPAPCLPAWPLRAHSAGLSAHSRGVSMRSAGSRAPHTPMPPPWVPSRRRQHPTSGAGPQHPTAHDAVPAHAHGEHPGQWGSTPDGRCGFQVSGLGDHGFKRFFLSQTPSGSC